MKEDDFHPLYQIRIVIFYTSYFRRKKIDWEKYFVTRRIYGHYKTLACRNKKKSKNNDDLSMFLQTSTNGQLAPPSVVVPTLAKPLPDNSAAAALVAQLQSSMRPGQTVSAVYSSPQLDAGSSPQQLPVTASMSLPNNNNSQPGWYYIHIINTQTIELKPRTLEDPSFGCRLFCKTSAEFCSTT